jgi:DNA-directed RNA polymerase II subunit RPB2
MEPQLLKKVIFNNDNADSEDNLDNIGDPEANLERDYRYILRSYFNQSRDGHQMVRHQIDSFDYFIEVLIPNVIKQFNPIKVYYEYQKEANKYSYEFHLSFGEIAVEPPMISENDGSSDEMTPSKARSRSLTYASNLRSDLDVKIIHRSGDPDKLEIENVYSRKLIKVLLGKIPIMVQSKYCILSKYKNISRKDLGECRYDPGGYFIINGNEKVIISQERTANNMVNIFKNNNKPKNSFTNSCEVKSESDEFFGSIRNLAIKIRAKDNAIRVFPNRFRIDLPLWAFFIALGIESDLEIVKMIVYDSEALENKEMVSFLRASIDDIRNAITEFKTEPLNQSIAMDYLVRNITYLGAPKDIRLSNEDKIEYLHKIMEEEFLPHCGPNFKKKAFYLGYAVNRLIINELNNNDLTCDDRDDYANKRVDSPGILMGSLLGQCCKALGKDMKKSLVKELKNNKNWKSENDITEIININNISKLVKPNIIEGGLKYSLATGDWKVKSSRSKSRSGTAQVLSRLTFSSGISHLRRVNSPAEKNGKIIPPRKIHNSSWGNICPAETPEGASVGLVKNLSNGSIITKPSPPEIVYFQLRNLKIPDVNNAPIEDFYHHIKIFVNGDLFGITKEPDVIVSKLRSMRRNGLLNIYTSIFWHHSNKEIYINTDGGRLSRPLCIVDSPNKLRIKESHIFKLKNKLIHWNNLILPQTNERLIYDFQMLKNITPEQLKFRLTNSFEMKEGVIEFVDCIESNNALIAVNQKEMANSSDSKYQYKYTHCEIMPGMMLGVLASCIPFADHNQSPRNTYQSAQGKQAMGIYATNYALRLDTLAHVLRYPQRPLVNTHFSQYFHGDKISNGINAVVAILCYTGYNQEDSVIISQSSIDRGFFNSVFYRSYKDDEKKIQSSGQEEKFANPGQLDSLTGDRKFDISIGKKRETSYKNLDERGFIKENVYVYPGDIIIGKIIPIRQQDKSITKVVYRDISTPIRTNEEGFVDKVYESRNSEGFRFCKVKIRSIRIPTIGDKFCLPGSTQVLTENGWVSLKDYDSTFKVLIYDDKSKTMRYEKPIQKLHFPSKPLEKVKMIEFCDDVSGFRLQTTLQHKIYAKQQGSRTFALIEAEKLYQDGKPFQMANNGRLSGGNSYIINNNTTYLAKPLAILFGIWLKYGSPNDKNDNKLIFNFVQNDEAIKFDVDIRKLEIEAGSYGRSTLSNREQEELFEEFKKHPQWTLGEKYANLIRGFKRIVYNFGGNPESDFNFNDRSVEITVPNLTSLFTMQSNVLPSWVYDLTHEDAKLLINAINDTLEGYEAGGIIGSDAFKGLIKNNVSYDLARLYIHTDLSSNTINFDKNSMRIIDDWYDTNTKNTTKDNDVYCLEVSTGIFMALDSNNKIPIWTGNSSRHGQKGTCGMIYPEENMPRTKSGIVPNIIVNPHAIPSRMTIGHLIECITGKVACHLGGIGDATAFNNIKAEQIGDALAQQGFEHYGDEILYSRIDGSQMKSKVFFGPTFYQRLKHMVEDKIHSRSTGPVVMLTRQCSEGRARDGGLRIGEMERDGILCHGISVFLKERLMDMSDNYKIHVCDLCGVIANYNISMDKRTNISYNIQLCNYCDNHSAFSEVRIPFSCKLLIQELFAMGIVLRLIPE